MLFASIRPLLFALVLAPMLTCNSLSVLAQTEQAAPVSLPSFLSSSLHSFPVNLPPDLADASANLFAGNEVKAFRMLPSSAEQRWFSISLDLSGYERQALTLIIDLPLMEYAEMYILSGETLIASERMGAIVPPSQVANPDRLPAISFFVPEGAELIEAYLNITAVQRSRPPVILLEQAGYVARTYQELLAQGAFFATLLMSLFLSLLFYRHARNRQLLMVAVFSAGNVLLLLCITGMGRVLLWGESGEATLRFVLTAAGMIIFSLAQLGLMSLPRSQLNIATRGLLDLLIYSMPVAIALVLLAPFTFVTDWLISPLFYTAAAVTIATAVIATLNQRKVSRAARYLGLSWAVIAVGYTTLVFYRVQFLISGTFFKLCSQGLAFVSLCLLLFAIMEYARATSQHLVQIDLAARTKSLLLAVFLRVSCCLS